jgi:AcrR family transcriptional regulator
MASKETLAIIVETALDLFNAHGSAAVSGNRIAEASGISKGHLHYHFRTKSEVVRAIFGRMVEEMNAGWYEDHLEPSIHRLAEMFARQILFIYNYRFFYRELAALLRDDQLLMSRYRENRLRRSRALEQFLAAVERQGELDFGGDARVIATLVETRWIISENWLNAQEILGREINVDCILSGYDLVLGLLRPYFVSAESDIAANSRQAISAYLDANPAVFSKAS